jgi:t-SNARE complex subunit (syntaxin)
MQPRQEPQSSSSAEETSQVQVSTHDAAINEDILREREEEIREIHQTVSKVNEVFKDLAEIVNDQQHEIDAVQSMIGRSHQHAQSGLQQVEKVRI